jgi:hypothetical protein
MGSVYVTYYLIPFSELFTYVYACLRSLLLLARRPSLNTVHTVSVRFLTRYILIVFSKSIN